MLHHISHESPAALIRTAAAARPARPSTICAVHDTLPTPCTWHFADLFSDSAQHSSGEASPLKRPAAYAGHKAAQLELSNGHGFGAHAV